MQENHNIKNGSQHAQPQNINNQVLQKKDGPKQCPYLSTIKKNLLDFDFEKICSITLSHTNIYACLVCGRYFQGRSATSPAYQHSIQFSHYVFLNLQSSKMYCLPDGYEVDSYTVRDVTFNLKPTYTQQSLKQLQKMEEIQYNVDGKQFIPGTVGMNNLGRTDYANVIVYMLNNIKEIRHLFALNSQFQSKLLSQFSILLRKIWNPKNFKGIVSPHEFLQCVSDFSSKKFKIGTQSDPSGFFLWLIDNMNKLLKKQKTKNKSDIQKLFKGKLKTSVIKGIKDSYEYQQMPLKVEDIQFSVLKLEFPQKGVFNKTLSEISLQLMLQKYVGKQGQKHPQGLRYAKIIQFPQYLVLVFKRFMNNGYTIQKDNSHLIYTMRLNIVSNNKKGSYRLITQICHSGDYQTGKYKIVYFAQQAEKWFQVQDLESKEVLEEQVLLAQPYMQVYKLQKISQWTKQGN